MMVDIAWCKPQKFSVLTCYYGNWNQLSSCYLSHCVDDFGLGHVSTDVTATDIDLENNDFDQQILNRFWPSK